MKKYEISTVQVVTQEQIDDVLADAFEHGVTHWCNEIREELPPEEDTKHFSDVLTRGGSLGLHDANENEWRYLNLDALLGAFGEMQFDFDNYDAMDADAVVQKAIFKEVVYG